VPAALLHSRWRPAPELRWAQSSHQPSQPWGETRKYEYGAPLGVEQLFSDKPPVGVS